VLTIGISLSVFSKGLRYIDWRGFFYKTKTPWFRVNWRLTKRFSKGLRFVDSGGLFCKTKTPWFRVNWRLTKRFSKGLRFVDSGGLFYKTKTPLFLHLFALRNALAWFFPCPCLVWHKKIRVFVFRSSFFGLRSSFCRHPPFTLSGREWLIRSETTCQFVRSQTAKANIKDICNQNNHSAVGKHRKGYRFKRKLSIHSTIWPSEPLYQFVKRRTFWFSRLFTSI